MQTQDDKNDILVTECRSLSKNSYDEIDNSALTFYDHHA